MAILVFPRRTKLGAGLPLIVGLDSAAIALPEGEAWPGYVGTLEGVLQHPAAAGPLVNLAYELLTTSWPDA